ncbi:MAG: VOC family protein [Gaiellaceae bacterium]
MLANSPVATRLPAQDLARARAFYAEKLGIEPAEERPGGLLYRCGVVFEEYDLPGLSTVGGIAEVEGNYPSKGGIGERAAWFRDSEGNMLGIGQPIMPR